MLFLKDFIQVLITGVCIVQALIYMCLLTIACLYNKAAVVTKMPVKFFIGVAVTLNNRHLYCAATDLHVLVNNNMLIATKKQL